MPSSILLPDKPDFKHQPKPQTVKATTIFQDHNYTFLRNKETLTARDVLDAPLHLFLISLGMLEARDYVPRVGKEAYLSTLKRLNKQFRDMYKAQKAIATSMEDPKK